MVYEEHVHHGEPNEVPRTKEKKPPVATKRLNLRVEPKELKDIKREAVERDTTASGFVLAVVREALKRSARSSETGATSTS